MLQIRALSKTYANGVHALQGVTLDILAACSACWGQTAPASRH